MKFTFEQRLSMEIYFDDLMCGAGSIEELEEIKDEIEEALENAYWELEMVLTEREENECSGTEEK